MKDSETSMKLFLYIFRIRKQKTEILYENDKANTDNKLFTPCIEQF